MPGEKDVVADAISLDVFKQQKNYDNFRYEWLIPPKKVEVEDQEAQ